MTIGELLSLMERDRDAAWAELWSALRCASGAACASAGLAPSEVEDLAYEGLWRVAARDMARLRDAGRRVLLSSWSRGVARNLVRERLRHRATPSLVADPRAPEDDREEEGDAATGWESLDLSSLTDSQAEAVRSRLEGKSERAAAASLGISRGTFRDRVQRAMRALKRTHGELPPLPEMSKEWAEELLDRKPSWLEPRDRETLRLYLNGATRADIAGELGLKIEGVRSLLRRLRDRYRRLRPRRSPGAAREPGRAPAREASSHVPRRGT